MYKGVSMSNTIIEQIHKEMAKDELDILEMERLIKICPEVNIIEDDGESILEKMILYFGYGSDITSLVNLLIERGIDVNYQDWYGTTSLHMAILSRSIPLIELLLYQGANPNLAKIEDSDSALDFALSESFMSDNEKDTNTLDDIIKIIIQFNGKPGKMLFRKEIDTYLLINSFDRYPTGLFTFNGNIYIEDIPNVSKEKHNEFMYWLVNERPADWVFNEKPDHPVIINYHKKQSTFVEYFTELFHGEIFVGTDTVELSEKVAEHKKIIHGNS
jgi:hypothetical protein